MKIEQNQAAFVAQKEKKIIISGFVNSSFKSRILFDLHHPKA
jgi:hypothetical protein